MSSSRYLLLLRHYLPLSLSHLTSPKHRLQLQVNEPNLRIFPHQTWACKLMICVWQYFILANYSWLLMEGLYLHSLIFMALFTDSSAITLYILLGWGGSLCPSPHTLIFSTKRKVLGSFSQKIGLEGVACKSVLSWDKILPWCRIQIPFRRYFQFYFL